MRSRSLVVFTDLDGSLLDHHSYSFAPAMDALAVLAETGVPVVLCSSKTRAEIELLQQQMRLWCPFISENGGALFVPRGYFPFPVHGTRDVPGFDVIEFGRPYAEIVQELHAAAWRLQTEILGFSDLSIAELARLCGLSLLQARLAKLREYDEPFRILDPSPASRSRLLRALHGRRLRCTRGARFDHVTGGGDKGLAVDALRSLYQRVHGEQVLTIGLGDSLNDLPLLRQVDVPVIVQNHAAEASDRMLRKIPTARLTNAEGPSGWAEAIVDIVDEYVKVPGHQRSWRRATA